MSLKDVRFVGVRQQYIPMPTYSPDSITQTIQTKQTAFVLNVKVIAMR